MAARLGSSLSEGRASTELAGMRSSAAERASGGSLQADGRSIEKGGSPANKFALDLFGDPVRPRLGLAGRPRHMPTDAQRDRIRELRASGMVITDIAAAVGLSHPTLQFYYRAELRRPALQRRS